MLRTDKLALPVNMGDFTVWQSGPAEQQDFEDLVLELHKIEVRAQPSAGHQHRMDAPLPLTVCCFVAVMP